MKPVYELTGLEAVNPPWANGNLDEWLYRPVKIRGRAVHSKEMAFRYDRYGYEGNLTFIPLVTREDFSNLSYLREGLILGIGWIPSNYDSPSNRERWENTEDYIDYVGIVTTNEEINGKDKVPNIYDDQHFSVSRHSTYDRTLLPS